MRKADVGVAKNYLTVTEIAELNRIVVMFLDFAEDNARRRRQTFLHDWQRKLDDFLAFNERGVLQDAGKVSHQAALERANSQFEAFAARRREAAESAGQAELDEHALRELEDAGRRVEAMSLQRQRGEPPRIKSRRNDRNGGSARRPRT